MSSVAEPVNTTAVRLRDLALAAVAQLCAGAASGQEGDFLRAAAALAAPDARSLLEAIDQRTRLPGPGDAPLVWLAGELRLSRLELLTVALATAVEDDPIVGRVLAHVQAPIGGSRPTLGLLAPAFARAFDLDGSVMPALLNGPAVATGLLGVLNDTAPLPERAVMVPTPLCLALAGHDSHWPGAAIGLDDATAVPLPDAVTRLAKEHAAALRAERHRALVLRTGSPAEGRSVARAIAGALNKRPLFVESDRVGGPAGAPRLRRSNPRRRRP
jgi:hypothetical protein